MQAEILEIELKRECYGCGIVDYRNCRGTLDYRFNKNIHGNILHILCGRCAEQLIYSYERAKYRNKCGRKLTLEERKTFSHDINIGRKHTEEWKKHHSAVLKGRKQTLDIIEKRISPLRGRRRPDELRQKLSVIVKERFMSRPELRENLSKLKKGKKISEEQRKKMVFFKKGNKPWNTGKKLSEEHKSKVRAAANKPEYKEMHRRQRLKIIIPSRDTSIEKKLQALLTTHDIQFKLHVPILGQPDIFVEPNICIFADGDYWHGKLIKGIVRDLKITNYLESKGYKVLRFWEHDIKKNIDWVWRIIEFQLFKTV